MIFDFPFLSLSFSVFVIYFNDMPFKSNEIQNSYHLPE
jgi:hypothetical protein